jgi:hypothetical protein
MHFAERGFAQKDITEFENGENMSLAAGTINDVLRKTADAVLRDWEVFHAQAERPILWHYTTMAGLYGIFTSGSMRFTDAAFLNDLSEMTWAVELFDSVVKERIARGGLLPEVTEFLERALQGIKSDLENRDEFGIINQAFVACFCKEGDSLHLWRAYTGNGRGYSIGFFPDFIRARLKPLRVTGYQYDRVYVPALRKVIYDKTEQEQHITALIDAFEKAIVTYISSGGHMTAPHVFSRGIYRVFYEYLCTFKHPTFSEEHEWRFIYLPDLSRRISEDDQKKMAENRINYRERDGYLLPFLVADIETDSKDGRKRLPFEEIYVGPGLDVRLGRRSINAYLLRKEFYLGSLIRIRESDVPLRVL